VSEGGGAPWGRRCWGFGRAGVGPGASPRSLWGRNWPFAMKRCALHDGGCSLMGSSSEGASPRRVRRESPVHESDRVSPALCPVTSGCPRPRLTYESGRAHSPSASYTSPSKKFSAHGPTRCHLCRARQSRDCTCQTPAKYVRSPDVQRGIPPSMTRAAARGSPLAAS
jgi:hypothetical protein